MTAALAGLAPLLAATTKKTTSNSSAFLYILIIIGAAFYFLIYRPQQKKARALRAQGNSFEVGDEVLTAGGIVGYVIDIDGDRVTLETSVGASFVVLRQYVLRKLDPPVDTDDEGGPYDEAEYDEADDDHDHADHDEADDDHAEHDETDGYAEADEDEADVSSEHEDSDAAADAERHPSSGSGGSSTNGKGRAPGTTQSADGDDSGGHDAPPII
jgi:preprotein translocase subunit YajC